MVPDKLLNKAKVTPFRTFDCKKQPLTTITPSISQGQDLPTKTNNTIRIFNNVEFNLARRDELITEFANFIIQFHYDFLTLLISLSIVIIVVNCTFISSPSPHVQYHVTPTFLDNGVNIVTTDL